jgi:hypothetical protein
VRLGLIEGLYMVGALHSWFSAVASWRLFGRSKSEDAPKVGAYPVDYSEPTQEEINAANDSCKELFETGNWVPVNRRS